MAFEWFVALRFLREGRLQTVLVFAGVAVGVGVIVFLGALIDGLQVSLIEQTLGSQAHVVIEPPEEKVRQLAPPTTGAVSAAIEKAPQRLRSIPQWQQTLALVDQVPGVIAAAQNVSGSAFIRRGTARLPALLRGVVPERFDRVIPLSAKMKAGRFDVAGTNVCIGIEMAQDLGVVVGDKIRLATDDGRDEVFSIAGVFDMGNKEVNSRWVVLSLRAAQSMLDLPGGVSRIEVKVDDIFAAPAIADQIADRTGMQADPWTRINAQLLVGLSSQSSSSWMIQFFVVLAVALGIASVLVVAVVQKSREIGILRAVGTSTGRIMRIFLMQGALAGLVGSLLGCLMGAGLSLFFQTMATDVEGRPIFPVDLNATRFVLASVIATVVGLAAAVAPARRAAQLDPAQVIRYG